MPNNYTNHLIIIWNDDQPNIQALLAMSSSGILGSASPVPDGATQRLHWGTKWEAYDSDVTVCLPGDTVVSAWDFNTAWCAPNERTRDAVAGKLLEAGAVSVTWIGIDPYDDSVKVLGTWSSPRR